jgi:hypothetical protein
MKKTPMMDGRRDLFYVESDFEGYVTGDEWTGGGDTTVPAVVADVPGGVVNVLTTAVDNEETWLMTTQECFLFQDKKPIAFTGELYYSEVTGDTANIFIGCMSALETTPFQDDGAGPKLDFSGFGFYRLDGGVVWNCIASVTTNQTTQALALADVPNNLAGEKVDADEDTLYNFHAECTPLGLKSATVLNLDWDFWINDIHVAHMNTDETIANFGAMEFGVAVHAGDAQILNCYVDYLSCSQVRIDAV